jgi:inorganic triphosphatase YgiF
MRAKGGHWIQTVKCGTIVRHGVSNPVEIEQVAKSSTPDVSRIIDSRIRKRMLRIVAGGQLEPIFSTDVSRTTRLIEIPHDGTIEMALDRGMIKGAGHSLPINEVELELKDGRPHALLTAAEALFADRSIAFSQRSKASLGYQLVSNGSGPDVRTGAPVTGEKPRLSRAMTGPRALAEVGQAACKQVLLNWDGVLLSDDPECAHQLRVGLRRFRAALRAFNPITRHTELAGLEVEARDLGRIVGALRDADVLINDILEPAFADLAPSDAGVTLRRLLIQHRARQRDMVRRELVSPRWTHLKLNCALFECAVARSVTRAGLKPCKGEVETFAFQAFGTAWRRVRKKGRNIDHLTIAERHEMRKSLKRLRYTTEYFASLYPARETRPFLQRLKVLQDVFGYLNDVTLSEALPDIVGQHCASQEALLVLLRTVHDWHQTRADVAWEHARDRWRDFRRTPRFWL